ncbi:anti-phage dCTP deaminase [Tistrella mobilis]|uniref:anti-phage dCTP deaminase n=1 Tax=Tistrella mobilis TaxID=171437 RepID=UPI00355806D4
MNDAGLVEDPELFVGLVGPIGVDLDAITKFLETAFTRVGYSVEKIHLTQLMKGMFPHWEVNEESYAQRYNSLIENADRLREYVGRSDVLSCLAISEIQRVRQESNLKLFRKRSKYDIDDGKTENIAKESPLLGTVYIIRQFKRPEEINLLRGVYGRKFIQVSIFSDYSERKKQIIKRIKEFNVSDVTDSDAEKQAIDLIEKDNHEALEKYGQRISDVFHLGDVFVQGNSTEESENIINRFVNAFFGHNGISPNKNEYGMYAAAGAALRSLDLSRQVGAAIFSKQGEVVTLGCNEVPKPFGGTYWCDDPGEQHRDFEEGVDENHSRKVRVLHDLVSRLGKLGYLSEELTRHGSSASQTKHIMEDPSISESRVMDLIEFGRIIHAEMSAITDAARLGRPLADTTLYCTTFPCHMCAKHIVSSGVSRVVFLEPYPKSHAKDLHSDSITFASCEADKKVLFEPFIGISPRRYRDIFEKKRRKDSEGKAVQWKMGRPVPCVEDRSSSYIENEAPAITLMTAKLQDILNQDDAKENEDKSSDFED